MNVGLGLALSGLCFIAGVGIGIVLAALVASGAYDKGYRDAILGRAPRD